VVDKKLLAKNKNFCGVDELNPHLEKEDDSKQDEDESTNLDDPEIMARLMNDLQV
jgi:hypothetical protein